MRARLSLAVAAGILLVSAGCALRPQSTEQKVRQAGALLRHGAEKGSGAPCRSAYDGDIRHADPAGGRTTVAAGGREVGCVQ